MHSPVIFLSQRFQRVNLSEFCESEWVKKKGKQRRRDKKSNKRHTCLCVFFMSWCCLSISRCLVTNEAYLSIDFQEKQQYVILMFVATNEYINKNVIKINFSYHLCSFCSSPTIGKPLTISRAETDALRWCKTLL